MAKDAGIELIQLYTNAYSHFRDLDTDYKFWRFEYHGSFLAAIAHAFAPQIERRFESPPPMILPI